MDGAGRQMVASVPAVAREREAEHGKIRAMPDIDSPQATLRQVAATLGYRAAKVLRDAPPEFGHQVFGDATRQPVKIVAHMGDLMTWGVSIAKGGHEWNPGGGDDWQTEVDR